MSLLKTMISEMAAAGSTGGGAIASVPGSLFGGGVVFPKSKKKKRGFKFERINPPAFPHLAEALGITSAETKFNAADVVSKLDAAEKQAKVNQDTVAFGLEDEEGNIIKVHVRSEQAQEFEKALGAMLSGQDEDFDDQNSAIEIAEVLFELRNKFDIVDVNWGVIPADEEEEQEVAGDEMNPEGEMGPEGEMPGEEDMAAMDGMDPGAGDGDLKSALSQVIDLLKSQAEAQKAEADARAAEAKAREAEASAKAAASKVQQEEETLEMEAHFKKKADEKKEAQRLAKLARYKHETAKEAEGMMNDEGGSMKGAGLAGMEQEERTVVSPRELAAAIFRQLQGN